MTFADYIRASGRTRADWADTLSVSRSFMSDLLNGNRRPSLELAVRIERETNGAIKPSVWVAPHQDNPQAPDTLSETAP